MKRISALLCSVLLLLASMVSAWPQVHAAGSNLIANPSAETSYNSQPASWSQDGYGTNTSTFSYPMTGHTGSRSLNIKTTSYKSGDAKWFFTPVAVTPNTSYTFSDWYKATATTSVDVVSTSTAGKDSYIYQGDPAISATWKQTSYTFTTPKDSAKITVYHYLHKVGELTTDDYSLVNNTTTPNPNPSAPTVAVTAPTANTTVSGTSNLTANASDAGSVSSVQFKVDGATIGAVDTSAPYSLSWDSKTVANGSHLVTAVATNNSNLTTTSSPVAITVSNTVSPTAPTVSLTAPATNATISGTTPLSANASDATAVKSVQFKVDGATVGAVDTSAPYSVDWDSKSVANGTHTITATATNSGNLSTTSSPITVSVSNAASPTAPTVSVTAPTANATLSGSSILSANASDTAGITSVQFKVDGTNVGVADTTAPYSLSWDSKSVTNGSHSITALATNKNNLTTTSSPITVTVNNPTAPSVSVTAPTAGSTVSGTASLTANASDSGSVKSVQFKIDGNNVDVADTTAPYSVSWNSQSVGNGSHSITAVATNNSNLTTTSSQINFNVSNTAAPASTNLIANPSLETAQDTATPANWLYSSYGNNTSSSSYLTTGHTGGRSVKVQTTKYTDGSANWYYNELPVTAGKTYQYSNWYQSNVDTEVDAQVTMSDGTVQYFYVGAVFANTNWTQFKTTFTPPAGAKSVAIYQILAKVGYVTSDDYSLTEYTPQGFNRGLVTVTFDDGWQNQYQNAYPVLQQLGIKSTFYIISGELDDTPDYMTSAQVKNLNSTGHEIGSHSVSHPDFTTLSAAQVKDEFANSKSTLENLIGTSVTNFAYPYGAYNQSTITAGKPYYASQRTVNGGYNTKDNLDATQLKMYEVDSNVSQDTVKGWINAAKAQNVWLILCYHEVANTPSAPDDALYTTKPADFSAEMNYLKSSGVATATVRQALTEVQAQ